MSESDKPCRMGERLFPIGEVPEDGSAGLAVRHEDDCRWGLVPIRRQMSGEAEPG